MYSDRGWALSNIGNRPLEWSAQEDCAWLELAPASGTLAPGAQVTLNLSVIESALAELPLGNHSAEIRFDNAGSNLGNAVREVILQHLAPGTGDGRGVKPGPHNTGPSDPSALKKVGSITVTKKGTVLENVCTHRRCPDHPRRRRGRAQLRHRRRRHRLRHPPQLRQHRPAL
ncbi:MAG: hypothetical protein R3F17_03720 [Planctomycetota bacterium]